MPTETITKRGGDCKDFTTLIIAYFLEAGIDPESLMIITVPGHMFPAIKIDGKHYVIDVGAKKRENRKFFAVDLRDYYYSGPCEVTYIHKVNRHLIFMRLPLGM